jgi:hypothetical protein
LNLYESKRDNETSTSSVRELFNLVLSWCSLLEISCTEDWSVIIDH